MRISASSAIQKDRSAGAGVRGPFIQHVVHRRREILPIETMMIANKQIMVYNYYVIIICRCISIIYPCFSLISYQSNFMRPLNHYPGLTTA